MKHTLHLHKGYIAKFETDDYLRRLKINGFNSKEAYFDKLLEELNDKYSFLNIDSIVSLTKEEEKHYNMFSGYVSGEFGNYCDRVVISFTELKTKNGNTVVTQQFMPLITNEILKDTRFLENDRIIKIGIINTIITQTMDMQRNKVKNMSSLQNAIQIMNTLGFDFIEMVMVKNLNPNKTFKTIVDYLHCADYLRTSRIANNQDIFCTDEGDNYVVHLRKNYQGQDQKFYGAHLLGIATLADKPIIVKNREIYEKQVTFKAIFMYIDYINANELYLNNIEIKKERVIISNKKIEYNEHGKKIYTRKPIKQLKKNILEMYSFKCACHNNNHFYFTNDTTKSNYVEFHHIIPFENQAYYMENKNTDLDVAGNIIPLCPHCHRLLHFAVPNEKAELLSRIYNENEEKLKEIDENITLFKLLEYYNVYLIS